MVRSAMEKNDIRQRLINKAHVFEGDGEICTRCGATILDALSMPVRCAGSGGNWLQREQLMTLSQAINRAENPV